MLHWIDPGAGHQVLYSLMIECALFGTIRLVRNLGESAPMGRT
jgi:hypothetical protein